MIGLVLPGKAVVQPGALPGAIKQPSGLAWSALGDLLVSVPRENVILQIRWPQ